VNRVQTCRVYLVYLLKTGKARRLKQAKEEAQQEIEVYRQECEKQYREHEAKVGWQLCRVQYCCGIYVGKWNMTLDFIVDKKPTDIVMSLGDIFKYISSKLDGFGQNLVGMENGERVIL